MALLLRVLVTSTVVAMMAAPAVASQPDKARCIEELARAGLAGRDVNPATANFILGTDENDRFAELETSRGVDVLCGFDGDDVIQYFSLEVGDVFLGGLGTDAVLDGGVLGTFNGGDGNDDVGTMFGGGTFNGGDGNDSVFQMSPEAGTFNGGEGNDVVFDRMDGGTFNGDEGNDFVEHALNGGTFNGGDDDDFVTFLNGGTFNGGDGNDSVFHKLSGTCSEVESGC